MKAKFNIVSYFLLCMFIVFASCEQEEFDCSVQDNYSMINVSANALYALPSQDKSVLGEAEYVIKRARLYAFDGNILDNMIYINNITNNNLGQFLMSMKVKQNSAKTLYLIINEPTTAAVTQKLSLINHPDAFESLEYEMADYITQAFNSSATFGKDDFCLPMYAKKTNVNTITTNISTPIDIEISAIRSLARVDIMVQKQSVLTTNLSINSSTKLSLVNTCERGLIAPIVSNKAGLVNKDNVAIGNSTTLNIPVRNANDNSAAIRAFTFYTPERDCLTTNTKLGFKLSNILYGDKSLSFDVTIGNQDKNLLNKIERNKVHKIYCTFTPKETSIELDILDWNSKDLPSVVPGTRLSVSESIILMDWARFSSTYRTRLHVDSDTKVIFEGYEHNGVTTMNGSNLPKWLPLDSITGMPNGTKNTHIISLAYVIDDTDDKYPVYLCFKAGNIKKKVEVIYDNGYLPRNLLSTAPTIPWTNYLPTKGIHISKIDNKTPFNTKSETELMQIWSDDTTTDTYYISKEYGMGVHGYGAYNTNIITINYMPYKNTAARRCRDLGSNWYLPTYNELYTIERLNNYLGDSYKMKSNSYHTSTTYSYYGNDHTCVILINQTNNYSYKLKTETSPVRCIRNY